MDDLLRAALARRDAEHEEAMRRAPAKSLPVEQRGPRTVKLTPADVLRGLSFWRWWLFCAALGLWWRTGWKWASRLWSWACGPAFADPEVRR